MMSRARFSAGLSRTGRAGSASARPSFGISALEGGASMGISPPGCNCRRAFRRPTAGPEAEGSHTRSSGAARAASRSRATRPFTLRGIILWACLSRTSSAASTRTVPGASPWPSFHSRREKAVRSAACPCLAIPRVLPPGRDIAASRGPERYSRRLTGKATAATVEARR